MSPQEEVKKRSELGQSFRVTLENQEHMPKPPALAKLQPNIRYDKDHDITKQVREYLREETTLPVETRDLTQFEWFAYYFSITNRAVPWQNLTQKTVGFWHQVLRGLPNVSIGIEPKSNAILEWQDSGVGKVGNVTRVTPGGDITVQELGGELPGVLFERELPQDKWRELRPVFISVA